jgi:hypothetical protein
VKSHRMLTITLFSSLIMISAIPWARAAIPDQAALESIAEAELTTVTAEVDKANILFSSVDDADGPNYAKVIQYHQEYITGCQDFQDRNYDEALRHLRKAGEIIRSRPSWTRFPDN